MRVGMLREAGRVVVEEAPRPALGAGEVLIRVAYAGVCGSDLHAFLGTHPFRVPPVVLGHELSGGVAEVGEGVSEFAPGDLVTVLPTPVRACRAAWRAPEHLREQGSAGDRVGRARSPSTLPRPPR